MQTRTRALAVMLALSAVLVACGDDSETTAVSGTPAPAQETTTTAAPTTTSAAPTTTTAAPTSGGSFAAGSPEDAAATAFATVFDSSIPIDAKKVHLADADALAETVSAYAAAGERFGGFKLTPTKVTIAGDTATVTYDLYFGTNKQYGDMTGSLEKQGDTWVVSRTEFCGFMQSARTPCPA